MNGIRHFAKSTAVYFMGSVLTKIISFLLLPIYTAMISTSDMGYYNVSVTCLSVVTSVLCLEIWTAILRFMYDYKNKDDRYIAVFNGMFIFLGSVILYIVLFFVLNAVVNIENIVLIAIYGLSVMLQSVYCNISRGLEYNTTFAVSGIIGSLVNSCANIFLILGFHMGANALYIAGILGFITQVIILESKVKLLKHYYKKIINFDVIKKMLIFSLPLSLNAVSYWMLTGFNNFAITKELGLSANGIFSVAARFSVIVTIISLCFTMAWQELLYSKGNDNDRSKFYTKASDYYIKFLMFALMMLIPFINITFSFFIKSAYSTAFTLVPLNLLAGVISVISAFYGNIFSAEKNTKIIFVSAFSAAIVNVSVLYLLIGKIGSQAANISLLCGFLTDILIKILFLKRKTAVNFNIPFLISAIILFGCTCYVYFHFGMLINILFIAVILIITIYVFRDLIKMAYNMWKVRKN